MYNNARLHELIEREQKLSEELVNLRWEIDTELEKELENIYKAIQAGLAKGEQTEKP